MEIAFSILIFAYLGHRIHMDHYDFWRNFDFMEFFRQLKPWESSWHVSDLEGNFLAAGLGTYSHYKRYNGGVCIVTSSTKGQRLRIEKAQKEIIERAERPSTIANPATTTWQKCGYCGCDLCEEEESRGFCDCCGPNG